MWALPPLALHHDHNHVHLSSIQHICVCRPFSAPQSNVHHSMLCRGLMHITLFQMEVWLHHDKPELQYHICGMGS